MKSGLVSITFRKLTPAQIVGLVARAGLAGIEWGGDIHVPHGRTDIAKDVGRQTRDAGLAVAAYGSYYRVGDDPDTFPGILDSALALQTKIVRVWMGKVGSAQADAAMRARIVADARRISELAWRAGLILACEWHRGTLTDTADSARQLFAEVNHPTLQTYWQPNQRMPVEQCLTDLDAALPRLAGLHVFQWDAQTVVRQPLADGAAPWRRYLDQVQSARPDADQMFALLEYVLNDDPEQFLRDAETLKLWL